MDISKIPDRIWEDLVSGKIDCQFDFLAVGILLARLRLLAGRDKSPEVMKKAVAELKDLFVRTANMAVSQKDLGKIIAKGGI